MAAPYVANPTQRRVGGGWATNAGSRESFHDGDMGWADAPSDWFDRLDAGLSIRNVIYVEEHTGSILISIRKEFLE